MNPKKFVATKKDANLDAYLYHIALTGSIYIKFKGGDSFLGSLRIGDHPGKSKYKYTWNLRYDISTYFEEFDRGTLRKYYPISMLSQMISDMTQMSSIKNSNIVITEE